MKKYRSTFVIFLLSLLLFAVFRLINLDKIPVFVDEAIYVRWSQVMKSEPTLRFLPLSDGKQPLAMWLTIPFFKIFSDPLLAGRLVSVVAGLGTLIGLSFLTYLLFGSLIVSSLTALHYAILPFTMFFDKMALADSLLAMFGAWSFALSYLFAKSHRLDHAMILGFFLGGGLITKSPAIFFYLWLGLCLIFTHNIVSFKKDAKNILLGLLAIILISQGIYSVLRLGPGFGMIGSRNQDYVFSLGEVLTHPFNPFLGNFKTTLNWLWLLFTPPVVLAVLLSFFDRKHLKMTLLLFTASLLPLLAQGAIAKVYTSRYILFAADLLIPLAALGLYWLFQKRDLFPKLLSSLALIVPLFISFIYLLSPVSAPMSYDMRNGYLEEWTAGWGQKEIAEYLIRLENDGDKIVVFTEGYFGTLPDGLQIYTEGHKNITIVGSPPLVNHLPEGLVNSGKENLNFLVLNKTRNHLPPSDLDKLTLITEYPKSVRIDGTREFLQFWQLK